jgi:hypothetical protein
MVAKIITIESRWQPRQTPLIRTAKGKTKQGFDAYQ